MVLLINGPPGKLGNSTSGLAEQETPKSDVKTIMRDALVFITHREARIEQTLLLIRNDLPKRVVRARQH